MPSVSQPLGTFDPGPLPDDIEPGILPLVEALRATWRIQTQFSCEGHKGRRGAELNPMPHVYFIAHQYVAQAIDTLAVALRNPPRPEDKLWFDWRISAYFSIFNGEHALIWRLEPRRHSRRPWSRRNMDADLRTLTRLIPRVVNATGEAGKAPTRAELLQQLGEASL